MSLRSQRRAAALLFALVIVSLVPVLALGAVRAASQSVTDSRDEAQITDARGIARSLVPSLLTWASVHEASPPDERIYSAGFSPIIDLTQDDTRVTVSALDLSGRLHTDHLDSRLRVAIPDLLGSHDATTLLDAPRRTRNASVHRPPLDYLVADLGVRVFTKHNGSANGAQSWLTTNGTGALNIRSARPDLLAAILDGSTPSIARRLSESDGTISAELAAEIIAAARRRPNTQNDVPLTDRSSAWGFLITVEHGPLDSRWWLVAEPAIGAPRPIASAAWETREFRRVTE